MMNNTLMEAIFISRALYHGGRNPSEAEKELRGTAPSYRTHRRRRETACVVPALISTGAARFFGFRPAGGRA